MCPYTWIFEPSLYQNPTLSGRLLKFNSKHPFAHKKAVIYNLVDREISLPDSTFHNSYDDRLILYNL